MRTHVTSEQARNQDTFTCTEHATNSENRKICTSNELVVVVMVGHSQCSGLVVRDGVFLCAPDPYGYPGNDNVVVLL